MGSGEIGRVGLSRTSILGLVGATSCMCKCTVYMADRFIRNVYMESHIHLALSVWLEYMYMHIVSPTPIHNVIESVVPPSHTQLASEAGAAVSMTESEKKRLEQLLCDSNEIEVR